ncbi:uncharacterized protein LOC124173292 [Ischnura elegans]|uniref:uncharacterized protein LOC124173292 n=1 Tax=Ischnura elegans TaxID=197161 RepID=UPI001ED8697C|nr:uncharacterized protein LOC124173292 [Ischnura elegans]
MKRRNMEINKTIMWKMVTKKKGSGTPKPCPICGKRFTSQLSRHIAKVHPAIFQRYGRDVVDKCSRGITRLVASGTYRYPEHYVLRSFGALWRDSPQEMRESLACLGVEVIPSGISLPEACGVEEETDVDGNADIGRREEVGILPPSALLETEAENITDNADIGRTEEVEVSPPSALLEVEAQNIPDNSEATEETALPVDRVEVPGQEADGGKSNAGTSEEVGESYATLTQPPSCNTSALLEVETENLPHVSQ